MSKLILPSIDPPTEDEYATFQQAVGHIDQAADALKRLSRIRNEYIYEKLAELLLTTKEQLYNIVSETAGGKRSR